MNAQDFLIGLTVVAFMGACWAGVLPHMDDGAKLQACRENPNCDMARLDYDLDAIRSPWVLPLAVLAGLSFAGAVVAGALRKMKGGVE